MDGLDRRAVWLNRVELNDYWAPSTAQLAELPTNVIAKDNALMIDTILILDTEGKTWWKHTYFCHREIHSEKSIG